MWKVAPSYANAQITKIDEENHKAYIIETCGRCGGSGDYIIPGIFMGTCFQCNGNGKIAKWVKAYTEKEYDAYMVARSRAKERKEEKERERIQSLKNNSEKNKAEILEKMGYDVDNPKVYIVTGDNTYNIKEELKERGGRFNPVFGWYFTKETEVPDGYALAAINMEDVYEWLPMVKKFDLKENAKEVVSKAKEALLPPSLSEYVGDIKERVRDMKVKLTGARAVESAYGSSVLFTFEAGNDILIWFTSCPPDADKAIVGHEYLLTFTVKAHDTYQGTKQTKINRCILKEI